MPTDFTKFPFPGVNAPHAESLTESIRSVPVKSGFIILAVKTKDANEFLVAVRKFAQALRSGAVAAGFCDITAYRQVRVDEVGGAMPFDQTICENVIRDAEQRDISQSDRYPVIKPALKMIETNDIADWTVMVEFDTPDQAMAASRAWHKGTQPFTDLIDSTTSHTLGAFKNAMQYANVSRDPNAIQFFNFFPGPGDLDVLWASWKEALPWFLETGELRSSFPLLALDPEQPTLLVNYAHADSLKHFFLGVAYDPNYLELVTRCYVDHGYRLPMPFFCKIVPV